MLRAGAGVLALLVMAIAGLPGVAAAAHRATTLVGSPAATVYVGDYATPAFTTLEVGGTVSDSGQTNGGAVSKVVPSPTENVAYALRTLGVDVINRADNQLLTTIPVAGGNLRDGVVSPDGRYLYVADARSSTTTQVSRIMTSPPYSIVSTQTGVTAGGRHSVVVALNNAGTVLYVGDDSINNIITIDSASMAVITAPVPVSGPVQTITASPDGTALLVTTSTDAIDVVPLTVNGIPSAPTPSSSVGCAVRSAVYAPDGTKVYAACMEGYVVRLDAASLTAEASLDLLGGTGSYAAISPDAGWLYVSSPPDGSILPVDLSTAGPGTVGTLGAPIAAGMLPARITIAGFPDPPSIGMGSEGNATASLYFTPPANTGNLPILDYWAVDTTNGVNFDCHSTTSPCQVTGLTNGTTYNLALRAVNSSGQSVDSNAVPVTPRTVPDAPTIGPATATSGQASIDFTPNGDGGDTITSYSATDTLGHGTFPCAGTSSPCVVTGLMDGTAYAFTLHATNSVGDSLESGTANSVTPSLPTEPDAPTIGTADAGDTEATVRFTPPINDGGQPIFRYRAVDTGNGVDFTCPNLTSPCVVTGLANGTEYHLTILARNSVGYSLPSGAVTVTPARTPDAPVIGTASGGLGRVSVAFTPPGDDGGAPITGYTATDTANSVVFACPQTTSPCDVTGLANGTTYTFTLHATNAAGDSVESSAANPATPATVPTAPTITGAHRGNTTVTLDFTDGATGGAPITAHTATDLVHGSFPCVVNGGQCAVQGLTNGTAYTFTLHATNSAGSSLESNAAAPTTPATVPAAPTISTAVPANAQVTLTFTDGSTGGDPITAHIAAWTTAGGGSGTQACPGSPCVVTALSNGTAYTFKVRATNGVGDSPYSATALPVTPVTLAGAPAITSLRAAGDDAAITFTAPGDSGGSPISGYQYSVDGGAWTALTTTGSGPYTASITGLRAGVGHGIRVRAVNGNGGGAPSASASVFLPTVPGAPTAATAVAGDGRATVSFTAPADDGGSAITGYAVVATPGPATVTCTSSPCTVTGLRNGTPYTFTVRAISALGSSAASAATAAVRPAGVPGAPTGLAGTPAATSIALSFSVRDTGGSPILRTEVSTDGGTTWTTLGGVSISGLTPGTAYPITVRAVNVAGAGPAAAVVIVTTLPAAIDPPTAVAGVSSVTVAWSRSASQNVTGYTVYARPGPATCSTGARDVTTCVIGGTAGISYTFTVVAHTAAGSSAASAPSAEATPLAPPVPPEPPANTTPTLTTPDGQPKQLAPGQPVVIIGTGFAAHSTARLTLYSTPIVLRTMVTDGAGNLTIKDVELPPGLAPGKHTLVASGVDPDGNVRRLSMTFVVKAVPAEDDKPGDDLPATGAAASPLAMFGFVLIVGGALLVRRSTRLRCRH
ncbi:hypothetical protein Ato02nite_017140 [Paractinoplanes toevensis]|uniref:Fibronectin type-III domain-containing protein n=2 Tax=Paractinoplanes toevensis TaxID=571911 RepID=A0A919T9A2_9ACTN|nr:hypothetical protein Ato02nite_017140 [Actinoplanes toevensis]